MEGTRATGRCDVTVRSFQDACVVVTGGASGIGLALGEAFGEKGALVALADVEVDALERATAHLEALGITATGVVADVANRAAVEHLREAVEERFGPVDVLCNNAGVGPGGVTWEIPQQVWEWVLGVDLWGVIHGIATFVPGMVERGRGHVVNTASVAGLVASPGMAPYAAAKHAVVGLSGALRQDLARAGADIGVTVVCPSITRTRMNESGRNWPNRFGPVPDAGLEPGHPETRQSYFDRMERAMPPGEVARRTVAAVLAGRQWVVFDEELGRRYDEHVEGILAATRDE